MLLLRQASNIAIVVCMVYWADACNILTSGAFAPRQRYEVYDILPDCPDAHWIRFNNTELTELRITLGMAKSCVGPRFASPEAARRHASRDRALLPTSLPSSPPSSPLLRMDPFCLG